MPAGDESRVGSFSTSLHIIKSKSEVTFSISLCLLCINMSTLHDNACSMLNFFKHTHSNGSRDGCHPYRKYMASKNSRFEILCPSDFSRRDVSQMDEPSEQAISLALICRVDILPRRSLSRDRLKSSMVWNLRDAGCSLLLCC